MDALEDNNTDKTMREEEEELPPCTLLQVALVGSFELVHREWTRRAVRAIILEHTNPAVANRVADISMEFVAKEAVTKKLMAAEWRAAREIEEKAAYNVGYPA
jgi:hypothetical protein